MGANNRRATVEIAQNRRARFDYFIDEIFEAGIVLTGTEVKSLRRGKCDISAAHADEVQGELFLLNSNIPEYAQANRFNHYPRRPRKLLLHAEQVRKLLGKIKRKGFTLVPVALYFNQRGLVKLSLGLARGKKMHDKRAVIKERDLKREQARGGD